MIVLERASYLGYFSTLYILSAGVRVDQIIYITSRRSCNAASLKDSHLFLAQFVETYWLMQHSLP